MSAPRRVSLATATRADAPLLSNLLELYLHDLSEAFPMEVGADGRFGYEPLALYWTQEERRFPFLIRSGSRVAGFALAARGSPATDDPADLDVAEFFVLRQHRRCGVGREAAFLLWNRLEGRWVVRVSEGNHRALPPSRICRGKSSGWISRPGDSTTMLSTRFRSSRTLPGHG